MHDLWYSRNKIRFEGEVPNCNSMVEAINRHLSFFIHKDDRAISAVDEVKALVPTAWAPPKAGWVKINCDASSNPSTCRSGMGCVIQDELGDFIPGKSYRQVLNNSILLLEIKAINLGLELAKEAGCRNVLVESDCLVAISLINSSMAVDVDKYSREIIEELDFCKGFTLGFAACTFHHTGREANLLAPAFAKYVLNIESSMLFFEKPNWASDSLYGVSEPFGV